MNQKLKRAHISFNVMLKDQIWPKDEVYVVLKFQNKQKA